MNKKDYLKAKATLCLLKKIRLKNKKLEEERKVNIEKLEYIIKEYEKIERK